MGDLAKSPPKVIKTWEQAVEKESHWEAVYRKLSKSGNVTIIEPFAEKTILEGHGETDRNDPETT